jgi:hypothetical protein
LVRVEIAIGFDAGRLLQLAKVRRPAVRQTIGMRPFVVLPAFRPLARGAQIDQFSHSFVLGGNWLHRAMLDADSDDIATDTPTFGSQASSPRRKRESIGWYRKKCSNYRKNSKHA